MQTSATHLATAFERARERGEPSTSLTPRLLRLPLALARHEMFVNRRALSRTQTDAIVDEVVRPLIKHHAR